MPHARSRVSAANGFTLIEVLVVVAIIAMLIAVLLPSLARARAQARSTNCLSNLHQSGLAMYQYALTYKDYLPRACNDGESTNWTVEVARTMGLLKTTKPGFTVNDLQVHTMPIFHCPERLATMPAPFLDYLVNSMDPRGPTTNDKPDPSGTWEQLYHTSPLAKISVYPRASDVIYLADAEREDKNVAFTVLNTVTLAKAREGYYRYLSGGGYGDGAIGVMDVWKGAHMPQGKAVNTSGYCNTSDAPGYRRVARKMHLNRFTNASFMDGHAASVPVVERRGSDGQPGVANYAYWLRLFGVQDAATVAAGDNDLN